MAVAPPRERPSVIRWLSPHSLIDDDHRDKGDLTDLTEGIRVFGVRQPVLARPHPHQPETYILVDGRRRRAAAMLAGLEEIPVVVSEELDDRQTKLVTLITNLHRKDLEPAEEGRSYHELVQEGLSPAEIAQRVGKSRQHVTQRIDLLKLPLSLQGRIETHSRTGLNVAAALELTRLPSHQVMDQVAEQVEQGMGEPKTLVDMALSHLSTEVRRQEAYRRVHDAGIPVVETGWPVASLALDVDEHAAMPCHAAVINDRAEVSWVCTDPHNHTVSDDPEQAAAAKRAVGQRVEKSEEEKAERKRVLAERKVVAEAATAREIFVQARLSKRTPKSCLEFILSQLVDAVPAWAFAQAEEWCGGGEEKDELDFAYAVALALGHRPLAELSGRGYVETERKPLARHLLEHLQGLGLEPEPEEWFFVGAQNQADARAVRDAKGGFSKRRRPGRKPATDPIED